MAARAMPDRRWDTKEANDGGVTNDAEMRAFFASCLQQRRAVVPEHFTLALFNPATHEVTDAE